MEFTNDQKYVIWIHYMVNQITLNRQPLEYNLRDPLTNEIIIYGSLDFSKGITYPALGIHTQFIKNKHTIKPFDNFCEGDDTRESSCLLGYYWRFKDEIFNNK